jgi:hypothetical protein
MVDSYKALLRRQSIDSFSAYPRSDAEFEELRVREKLLLIV